jgi:predicted nucleic acid-binding protein
MNYLLDTNVVSEFPKPRPNEGVLAWLEEVQEDSVFLSVVTIAELRHGIDRLPSSKRRRQLDEWLRNDVRERFEERTVPVDAEIADACGKIMARLEVSGRRLELADALIAATAQIHKLVLVTRNVSHFQTAVEHIVTPWV